MAALARLLGVAATTTTANTRGAALGSLISGTNRARRLVRGRGNRWLGEG